MKKFAFYLDLDGVFADYDAGIKAMGFTPDPELNKSSILLSGTNNAKKREMYEAIKGTAYYANLPLMEGSLDIMVEVLKHDDEPAILTAAPKFDGNEENYYLNPHWLGAAFHKRNWVETILLPKADMHGKGFGENFKKHLSMCPRRIAIRDDLFICTTSSRKHEFINRKEGEFKVLIDDRPSNIAAWANAGGIGILHTDVDTTIKHIRNLASTTITYADHI